VYKHRDEWSLLGTNEINLYWWLILQTYDLILIGRYYVELERRGS